jgi:arylsulfatase
LPQPALGPERGDFRAPFQIARQLNFESDEPFWETKNGWPLQRGFEEYFGTIHGVNSYYDPFSLVRGNPPVKPGTKEFY